MADNDDPTTEQLRVQQVQVARRERHAAEDAPTEDEARAPDRRAEKAAYLAAKLAKREQSERE